MRSTRLLLLALLASTALSSEAYSAYKAPSPATREIVSGTTDTASPSDYQGSIIWDSSTTGAKTETLPACGAGNAGMRIEVFDGNGSAATYNIAVTAASGNVGGSSQVLIASNYGGTSFTCDGGSTNWVAIAGSAAGGGYSELVWDPSPQVSLNTFQAFRTVSLSSMVDNLVLSAGALTCSTNPTIELDECGTSSTCALPAVIGSGTITATGTAIPVTVSNPQITAGDYVAWRITAGVCTVASLSGRAQIHVGSAPPRGPIGDSGGILGDSTGQLGG